MDKAILELIVAEQTGELTAGQQSELKSWRLIDHNNEEAYQATVKLWEDAGDVAYQSQEMKAEDWKVISTSIHRSKQANTNWIMKVAAVMTLMIAASILVYRFYLSPYAGYSAYEANGSIKEVSLADGSVVTLNRGSELWVSDDFNSEDRAIKLSGEAYFEVAENDQIPFVITGEESITEVVGTAFNLLVEEASVELTVSEGLVSFGNSSATIPVGAGQSAVLSKDIPPTIMAHNLNRLSWKTGILRFDEVPLVLAIEDIAKHYNIDVEVSEGARNLRLTSQYQNTPFEEVLNELELILGLDIRLNNTTYQVNLK